MPLCDRVVLWVNWQGDVRAMKKCVHYIFERLGGFQCRQHVFRLSEEGKPETKPMCFFGFLDGCKQKSKKMHVFFRILAENPKKNMCFFGFLDGCKQKSKKHMDFLDFC